ncbi:MAG: SPFH domain-containing protein [Anaerolineae bacterium]
MSLQKLIVPLGIGVLFLAFAATLPLVLWGEQGYVVGTSDRVDFFLLVGGFLIALVIAPVQVIRVLSQYTQALHNLNSEDAQALTTRLLFGAAQGPLLQVQSGQVDLHGPPVIYEVGGPASLSVDHTSVVVTSRLGRLSRVLGPGFHNLAPFERVWDVVDLRPQRRTVTVEFMTRDGIPASCQATLVCRIAAPDVSDREGRDGTARPFAYSEDAILKVVTSKHVRKGEGSERVFDWARGMAERILEATVRNVLEQYRLDQFLNPQYWLDEEEGPPRTAASPKDLPELEAEVEAIVRQVGREQYIDVDRVELGTVRPSEEAIPRQWLEFWQAKLQKGIDRYAMEVETTHEQLAEDARVEAQVTFINRMLEEIQQLQAADISVPPQLIIASFLEAFHSMADRGPEVQSLLFRQAENLIRVVNMIQMEDSPLSLTRDEQSPALESEPEDE